MEFQLVLASKGMEIDQKWGIYTTFLYIQLDSDFSTAWEITIVFFSVSLKHLYDSTSIFITAMKCIYKCYEILILKIKKSRLWAGKNKAYQKAVFMNILI